MSRFRITRKGAIAPIPDVTPDAFTFTDVSSAALSTTETSNTITVSGLGTGVSVAVTVSGGTFQKNGGAFGSSASTAVNGDTFAVQHTSSGSNSTAVNTTLTIGGMSDTYTSTTLSSGGLTPTYDTRFGTATDTSTGQITFGLRSGCRRVWLNSSGGSDSNSGLSAALAKATFDAAMALFWGSGWTAGDQLMIAGTGGRSYTDNKTGNWSGINGFSLTYPLAVLSYDPTDATNSAKYGKLSGPDLPLVTLATAASSFELSTENGGSANYYAIQGIEFEHVGGSGAAVGWGGGKHIGLCAQNNRFKLVTLAFDNAGSASGLQQTVHVSKNSFWGQWSSGGNCQGSYLGGIDGLYFQDNILVHCGWKIGVTRDQAYATGGPTIFCHGIYYHAVNQNGHMDRNVFIDSAHDGLNVRGDSVGVVNVTLDEPIAATFGGFSGGYLERPLGVQIQFTDLLFMGGDHLTSTAGDEYGWGPRNNNTLSGSGMDNVVAFDNPQKALGFNALFYPGNDNAAQVPQFFAITRVREYNYSTVLEAPGGADPTIVHAAWNGALVDSLTVTPAHPTTTLTSVTVHSGLTTYPLAKTRDQIVTAALTAVGITPSAVSYAARKAQLVNIMLWKPNNPWAQMLTDIAFPAYGATPTYAAATIPNLSAETPRSVY